MSGGLVIGLVLTLLSGGLVADPTYRLLLVTGFLARTSLSPPSPMKTLGLAQQGDYLVRSKRGRQRDVGPAGHVRRFCWAAPSPDPRPGSVRAMANLPPAAELAEHAQQLTVYISEQDHWRKQPLYLAVCDLLRRQGGAGGHCAEGPGGLQRGGRRRAAYGPACRRRAQSARGRHRSRSSAERIAAALPALREMIAGAGGRSQVTDLAGRYYTHPGLRTTHGGPLRVRQIMATQVVTVPPEMPLADVVPLLLNKSYSALPVVDPAGRVPWAWSRMATCSSAGISRGCASACWRPCRRRARWASRRRCARCGRAARRRVMSWARVRRGGSSGPDATVADAARLMVRENVKRLPVLDSSGRLIGIVGRSDVLESGGAHGM